MAAMPGCNSAQAGHPANQPLLAAAAGGALRGAGGRALGAAQRASIVAALVAFPVRLLHRDVDRLAVSASCARALREWLDSEGEGARPTRVSGTACGEARSSPGGLAARPARPVAVTPELRMPPPALPARSKSHGVSARAGQVRASLVLLVDTREVRSKTDRSFIESELLEAGVAAEVRQLPLGDFLWVVRCTRTGQTDLAPQHSSGDCSSRSGGSAGGGCSSRAAAGQGSSGRGAPISQTMELVTDFIVERKRADDLAASIIDGRYTEQKRRLAESACKRPALLVEGGLGRQDMLSAEALRSAMRSSRAGDGLAVSTTGSAAESVKWLASMDRALRRRLGLSESLGWADMTVPMIMEACALATVALPDGQLQPIAYEGFAAASRKTQPVTLMDAFARGIRHVPSLSAARAQALLVFAPTMAG